MEGGRELTYGVKQGSPKQPLITIITSTFNAAKDLHWTIESIRAQSYPNIQWIIADGASKDGTVEILKQNEDVIDYWFSEPDSGIYDAWNKALPYIKGEWVQFLGAGDELYSKDTLSYVASVMSLVSVREHRIIYGKICLISEVTREVICERGIPWHEMKNKWQGMRPMLPMHPEVYHHCSLFKEIGKFDTSYKIAADSDFLLKCKRITEFFYIDYCIDRMLDGGVSSNPKMANQQIYELVKLSRNNDYKIPLLLFFREVIKYKIKEILYRLSPVLFLKLKKIYGRN